MCWSSKPCWSGSVLLAGARRATVSNLHRALLARSHAEGTDDEDRLLLLRGEINGKIDTIEPSRSTLPLMDLLGRLVVDPSVRFGKPCVRGTRIAVGDVLGYLAAGMNTDQILQDFPQLARDDVRACLVYAAERERDGVRLSGS